MKRVLIIMTVLLVCAVTNADMLIKRNGDDIDCRVVRITPSVIVYTLPNQAVEREINVSDVFMVKYGNGSKEMFNTSPENQLSGNAAGITKCKQDDFFPVTSCPVIVTDYSGLPPASKQYQMWDVYEENGLRGIVVEVTEDGRHGKIISLPTRKFSLKPTFHKLPNEMLLGCDDFHDGEYNTRMIRQTCEEAGFTGEHYPNLLKWLDELGPGWYIPSYGELLKLNYDFQIENNQIGLKQFQKAMDRVDGVKIKRYQELASSSEVRIKNTRHYTFAMVWFDKDTYRRYIDVPLCRSRVWNVFKAYHKF